MEKRGVNRPPHRQKEEDSINAGIAAGQPVEFVVGGAADASAAVPPPAAPHAENTARQVQIGEKFMKKNDGLMRRLA